MHAEHQGRETADLFSASTPRRPRHGLLAYRTTHHFRVLADGGAIEADVIDPTDAANTAAIREHMQQIAKMFTAGISTR